MSAHWSLTTSVPPVPRPALRQPRALDRAPFAARAVAAVLLWQQRAAQRRHLAALDDALLRDIGISRADAVREAAKPFWRD